jgi:tetratricopeptide (TPR) repeat protein
MSKDDDDAPSETARENREAPDDALLACRRAIASDPANAANWEHLGDLLVRRSETYEAREAYARAYELQPDLLTQWIVPGANAVQRAQIEKLFSIGLGLNDAGHFEASLRVFEALAVIEPTWSFPLTLCGMVLCNLRQYAEALPYLDRALALDPEDVGAWTEKTLAFTALGLEEEARAAHQRENAARRASGVAAWMPRDEDGKDHDHSHLN